MQSFSSSLAPEKPPIQSSYLRNLQEMGAGDLQ